MVASELWCLESRPRFWQNGKPAKQGSYNFPCVYVIYRPDTGEAPRKPPGCSLSAEARSLVEQIDAGGAVPAVVTANLRRIAATHGIGVTDATTPEEIIAALRQVAV